MLAERLRQSFPILQLETKTTEKQGFACAIGVPGIEQVFNDFSRSTTIPSAFGNFIWPPNITTSVACKSRRKMNRFHPVRGRNPRSYPGLALLGPPSAPGIREDFRRLRETSFPEFLLN